MITNNTFSFHRFFTFLKSELYLNRQGITIFTVTIIAVLFLFSLNSIANTFSDNFHTGSFVFLLFGGGLWISSNSFKDLHDKERSQAFLTLPASNSEKFLGRLVLTSLAYSLGLLSIFYCTSLITTIINSAIFKLPLILQPLNQDIFVHLKNYLIIQSVFLLGAVYFKKHALSKTILSLCCLFLLVSLFAIVSMSIFSGGSNMGFFLTLYMFPNTALPSTEFILLCNVFWILVAPLCWCISYTIFCSSEIE